MGVNILERTANATSGTVVDTGTAFVVGPFTVGPSSAPALCQSIPDVEATGITRTAAQSAWDWLDVFFREGGNRAYVLDYTTPITGLPTALNLLTSNLGPGQLAVVGETATSGIYGDLQAHVDANNRIALLDVKSTDITAAEMAVEGGLAQALTSKENIGVFGSWVDVPAPAGVIGGTTRTVPASAVIAALCNRVDQLGNPNRPAGGRDFPLQYANDFLFDPVLAADQTTLKAAGVNFFHDAWGVLENYEFLTPIYTGTPITSTPFWQLNCSRARMWLKARATVIGEAYYMKTIDAEGKLAGMLGRDLSALLKQLYDADGLYGATPQDAYSVNISVSVNNNGTAATGTLNAVATCRFSQYADTVNITLVSVPVAGQVI